MGRYWRMTIDFEDLWERDLHPRRLAKLVIERFRDAFEEGEDEDLDELLDELEIASESNSFSIDAFDYIWDELYDWADEKSVRINC